MRLSLLALLLAVPALAADPPAKPNPLLGTWVREAEGTRVLVALGDKRVNVTLHQAMKDDRAGKVERLCLKLDADYGTGPDGRLFGVVTGVEATGTAGMMRSLHSLDGNLEAQLEGMPFAIRVRIDEGVLSLSGLRAEAARGSNYAQLLSGKFRRTDDRPLAKLKPAKAETAVPGMTLPSPHYLQHTPTYFPPDPPIAPAGFGGPPPVGVITAPNGDQGQHGFGTLGSLRPGQPSPPLKTRIIPPEELPPIPILPLREEAPKPRAVSVAVQMMCLVEPGLQHLPDLTKNGEKTAVLMGRLFLFGADQKPLDPCGSLTLQLTDTTPRVKGRPAHVGQIVSCDAAT